ncbi:MAG TPA: ATP-binding protein, partial [bacterium]|nr:ATP-binding protein [bacterium]
KNYTEKCIVLKSILNLPDAENILIFEPLAVIVNDLADECDNLQLEELDTIDTLNFIDYLALAEKMCVNTQTPAILEAYKKLNNIIDSNIQFILLTQRKKNEFIKINASIIDQLSAVITELSINKSKLLKLSNKTGLDKALTDISSNISNIVNRINGILSRVTFMPLYQVFNRFPSIVRDIANKLGKKIDFIIKDNNVVIDKKIGDTVSEVFIHLVKNSVDHGIELPEVRIQNGKSEVGKLELIAEQKGNYVIIRIIDDGKGMDKEIIGRKAVEKNIITETELKQMSDSEILELIFKPGFSTAEKVTDVSGRGVGMDAVKSSIEKLGGSLNLKSEKGKGSEVIIRIPFQMILTQMIFVKISEQTGLCGFMLDYLHDIIYFDKNSGNFILENDVMKFKYRDKLEKIWRMPEFKHDDFSQYNKALIFQNDNRYLVLPVSEIIEQTDAIVKNIDFIDLKNKLPK